MIDDNDGDMGSDNETKKPSRNQSKKIKEKKRITEKSYFYHNWQ